LSLKCSLPNHISFDVFNRCFCKVETRACETQRNCAKPRGHDFARPLTFINPAWGGAQAIPTSKPRLRYGRKMLGNKMQQISCRFLIFIATVSRVLEVSLLVLVCFYATEHSWKCFLVCPRLAWFRCSGVSYLLSFCITIRPCFAFFWNVPDF